MPPVPWLDRVLAVVLVLALLAAAVVLIETNKDVTVLVGVMGGPLVMGLLAALLGKRQAETKAAVDTVVKQTNGVLTGTLDRIEKQSVANGDALQLAVCNSRPNRSHRDHPADLRSVRPVVGTLQLFIQKVGGFRSVYPPAMP
jgi:hypothetical protein